MISLRPYQEEAHLAALEAINAGQRMGLWVKPTGTGKTRAAVAVAETLDVPTLFLVHRDELVTQTVNTFQQLWSSASIGVVKAERNEWQEPHIVVASVQTLNKKRLETIPRDRFGLLIADECHHTPAPTWSRAITWFESGFRLGMTATPDRLDGKGLAEWFGPAPLYVYSLPQAIKDSWLVKLRQYAVETDVDLDGVAVRAGDFAEGDLSNAVNTDGRNKAVAEAYQEHARGRRAVVFAVDLDHVRNLAQVFQDAGIKTASITGKDHIEDRRETLRAFARGEIEVLINCEVCTEGFDDRGISCIIMARPTKSRALYTQCVGRGLRLCPEIGKEDLIVLDITDNCRKHKLITACSLLGAKKIHDANGQDVLAAAEQEEEDEQIHQEELLAAAERLPIAWRLESVCPWPLLPDLSDYVPRFAWHHQPASEKQLQMLVRAGLELKREFTKGEASHLIDQVMLLETNFPTPATAKQEWFLRYSGVWEEGMSKKEASRKIAELKKPKSEEPRQPGHVENE